MTAPILPKPPATVEAAMALANDLAYGFPKHTNPVYWETAGYANDPEYFFKKMLGFQLTAASPDKALYGLYALPDPTPWHSLSTPGAPGDPSHGDGGPVAPAPPNPPDPYVVTLREVSGQLSAIAAEQQALHERFDELLALAQRLKIPPLTGKMVAAGKTLTLTAGK